MIFYKTLWLTGLAATASATTMNRFYGKNALSKLLINKVVAERNCGCNGTWDPTAFANISEHFGASLAGLVPVTLNTTSGQATASPLSIGGNTYTLTAAYSDDYNLPGTSNATVWTRLISDMLVVGNHSRDDSIITGEYINTLGGTHNLTLTVYGDAACSGVFKPCQQPVNVTSSLTSRAAGVVTGPGLDWSDKEAVKNSLQIPVHNSTSLQELLATNETLPPHIYHEGIGAIIDTSTIVRAAPSNSSKLQDRQYCLATYYTAYYAEGTWSSWGNWLPVSSCIWTGLDSGGASLGFSVSMSLSFAESWSLGWKIVDTSLSPSFSFTITESYTEGFSYTCNVPGGSVGQVWQQPLVAYGYIYSQLCADHGACGVTCNAAQGPDYSGAPGNQITQIGCSTGDANMACDAYQNAMSYSIWSSTPPWSD